MDTAFPGWMYTNSEKKKLQAELRSPQIYMLNSQSLVPHNITTFGDKVFKEVS